MIKKKQMIQFLTVAVLKSGSKEEATNESRLIVQADLSRQSHFYFLIALVISAIVVYNQQF